MRILSKRKRFNAEFHSFVGIRMLYHLSGIIYSVTKKNNHEEIRSHFWKMIYFLFISMIFNENRQFQWLTFDKIQILKKQKKIFSYRNFRFNEILYFASIRNKWRDFTSLASCFSRKESFVGILCLLFIIHMLSYIRW
jgi:hypothetical protein